jgi:protein-tyrosine phosphatase
MGYVDLHCHYIPGVDDGVRTLDESVRLCVGLARIGFERAIATPHIRTAMFDNRKEGLTQAFNNLVQTIAGTPQLPELGLACEHFCDDVFFELFSAGNALPYPGGHAALIELPPDQIPVNLAQRLFQMNVRGVRPVLAHPERYTPLFSSTAPIERLIEMGVLPQLDVMALTGKYGRAPKKAAERMLKEDVYFIACSDSHRPDDVEVVEDAIKLLKKLVGRERADELLSENPRHVLEGTFE